MATNGADGLLIDIRDRLDNLPERLASAMVSPKSNDKDGKSSTPGKSKADALLGNDFAGNLVRLLFVRPKERKDESKAPAPKEAAPKSFRLDAPLPLPVQVSKAAPSAGDANSPRPAVAPRIPVATPTPVPPGVKPAVAQAASFATAVPISPPKAVPTATPVSAGPSPIPARPVGAAPVSPAATRGLPSTPAAGDAGRAETTELLRQILAALKKLAEQRPQSGEQKAASTAGQAKGSPGYQTVFDARASTGRALASPSVAVGVKQGAGGPPAPRAKR